MQYGGRTIATVSVLAALEMRPEQSEQRLGRTTPTASTAAAAAAAARLYVPKTLPHNSTRAPVDALVRSHVLTGRSPITSAYHNIVFIM